MDVNIGDEYECKAYGYKFKIRKMAPSPFGTIVECEVISANQKFYRVGYKFDESVPHGLERQVKTGYWTKLNSTLISFSVGDVVESVGNPSLTGVEIVEIHESSDKVILRRVGTKSTWTGNISVLSRQLKDGQFKLVSKTNPSSNTTSANNNAPVNDHTCASCGNDRCSKSEKNCWRCGAKI